MREIAAGRPGLVTAVGPGHVRRSAADRRQAERQDDRGPRRGRHDPRPRVAALPRLPDRRRGHPGHDRRRGRQPDDGGRGDPGRDAVDGHGRAQQRRHRHRPGPPARDPGQPADARRQGAGCPDRPRLRGPGASGRPTSPRTRPTTPGRNADRSDQSRRCRSMSARSSPAGRCWSSRPAPSATSASASASSSAGSPGRRASPTSSVPDRRAGHLRRRPRGRQRGRCRASTTRP